MGDYGLIATSVDGESWSNFYPNGVSMLNVLHTGSLFVAVGVDETNGNIVINTSPDGMAWTTRVNAFHSYAALWGLAQNGSTLVAVGGDTASLSSSNKLAYSTDGGLSWTIGSLLASPTGNVGFNNVAYVNGKFVAVGTAATIATSTDGITWGTANSGETFLSLVGVGGNGSTTYVTSVGGVILSSTDNVTFTRPMSPPFSTAAMVTNPTFLSVKDIDGTLWAVGGNSSATGGVILKSTDGQTFSNTLSSNPQPDIWEIIKVGATYYAVGGLFVNSTNYNAILTSNDGAAWTAQSMGGFTAPIRSIAYLNGQFITVGAGNSIRTSPDGVTWTQRTSGLAGGTFFGVAYGNGVYVAVGGVSNPGTNNFQSHVVTSTDGVNWTVRFANTPNMFRGIVFQDGVFTAVGNNGEIRRSEDGINWWHANDSDLQTNFLGISYLDGHYYVTAASGNATSTVFESQSAVLISSNGDEWVRVTLGTSNIPYRTALFQNRLYVAASGASIIRSQTLTPVAPPIAAIVTPAGGTSNVPQGTSLTLTANVTSDGATSYQWFKGGVDIPDATGPGLTLDNVQAGDAGSYTVVVTNAAGSDTSDPIVVSVNATAVAPKILFHPESQTLNVGFNVTLSVEATGTAPLTYVWKKDGVVVTDGGNISGATTPELTLTGLTATNGGSYTVEVSNGTAPNAVSLPAILTVDSNPAYNFTIMAGSPGLSGTTDATGWGARFDAPQGIAVDGSGNVYVASPNAHTIRKVTSANVVTTIAGTSYSSGLVDDVGTAARFNGPRGLALNAAGTMLYVADTNNGKIRRVDLSTNTVTTWATGLNSPLAIVLDAAGNAYVASWDHTIRKISPDGLTITPIAGATYAAGSANNPTGTGARFNNPMAIAIDPAGANLYVADSANALIRKVSLTAPYAVTTYAGLNSVYGYADGPALSGATFSNPMGVAVDPAGSVIVADNSSDTIRKISPNGFVRTIGGQPYWRGFNDGPGDQARFGGPTSIAADANGNLYLLENANHIVRRASASASPLLPVIQFSPHDQTVAVGEDVLFGVVATGVSTLSYQWQKDGVNLGGATNPTLPLT
ncbi:MAG: immunoglobulin domain-containing protein [Opitutaceae bacterium]|nr:immunoglobulin domain-containing protein [Opitutaceae bacterium]